MHLYYIKEDIYEKYDLKKEVPEKVENLKEILLSKMAMVNDQERVAHEIH